MQQRLIVIGMLALALLLRSSSLISRACSNGGLRVLAPAVALGSSELSLDAVVQAEGLLGGATSWDDGNLGAHRGLGIANTLLGRPRQALSEWRRGVPAEDSEAWNNSLWYRAGTALAPGLNGGMADDCYAGQCLVLDSFSSAGAWIPCPWCDNAPGSFFGACGGILQVRYSNIPEHRSGFSLISELNAPSASYSEVLIRLMARRDTFLVMELVVDGVRTRPCDYEAVPEQWEVWAVPIQGQLLNQIAIGGREPQAVATAEDYWLVVDWIALR
jgi:hypothetical protein